MVTAAGDSGGAAASLSTRVVVTVGGDDEDGLRAAPMSLDVEKLKWILVAPVGEVAGYSGMREEVRVGVGGAGVVGERGAGQQVGVGGAGVVGVGGAGGVGVGGVGGVGVGGVGGGGGSVFSFFGFWRLDGDFTFCSVARICAQQSRINKQHLQQCRHSLYPPRPLSYGDFCKTTAKSVNWTNEICNQ